MRTLRAQQDPRCRVLVARRDPKRRVHGARVETHLAQPRHRRRVGPDRWRRRCEWRRRHPLLLLHLHLLLVHLLLVHLHLLLHLLVVLLHLLLVELFPLVFLWRRLLLMRQFMQHYSFLV